MLKDKQRLAKNIINMIKFKQKKLTFNALSPQNATQPLIIPHS